MLTIRKEKDCIPTERSGFSLSRSDLPAVDIMDEPTVGIDPQSRNHILKSILTMREQGATILYSAHYMEEVGAIADRILILDEGQIIASGTKDELCQRFENQITYNFTLDRQPEEQSIRFSGLSMIKSHLENKIPDAFYYTKKTYLRRIST